MNRQTLTPQAFHSLQGEGMLFVRIGGIPHIMSKVPLFAMGLVLVALAMPIQHSYGTIRTLDLAIGLDGTTSVSSELEVDPANPGVDLLGPTVDNFVAKAGDTMLDATLAGDRAILEWIPDSDIMVSYDVHDLVSKEGRTWTFSLDSPVRYTLLMPENSVIVRMGMVPSGMEIVGGQVRLVLAAGHAEIEYVFGTPAGGQPAPAEESWYGAVLAIGIAGAAGLITLVILQRLRPRKAQATLAEADSLPNPESIFATIPEMREDDKEIVRFIRDNSGQVLESDLRKKFIQPRTTMWRAVKRLERLGIVEIYKKDQQNMVRLKEDMGQ